MIDFNPSKIKRSKATEAVCEAIDTALVRRAENKSRRAYLGASAIGSLCQRRVQYEFLGEPYDVDWRPSARTQRIFARGHMGEDLVARWLRGAGYDLQTQKPDGGQFGFSVADGRFSGHCDGIVRSGPAIDAPCLWENKVLGAKSWAQIDSRGVAKAKPEYADQVAIYQAYLDLTTPAMFTALNADTCEIYVEFIKFDKKRAQAASDRAVAIIQDSDAGALRPRISDDPEFWLCQNKSGRCEFWSRCHGD